MITKEEIISYCKEYVAKRIEEVTLAINDADDALANDTKSSAGDKYETSREMVQQDINRYQKQLALANQDQDILNKIEVANVAERIALGSLVKTDLGLYFISISIGMIKWNGISVFVISPLSPIGQILMGKSVQESISFNNKTQQILQIT